MQTLLVTEPTNNLRVLKREKGGRADQSPLAL